MKTKIRGAVLALAGTVGLVAGTAGPAAAGVSLVNHSQPR